MNIPTSSGTALRWLGLSLATPLTFAAPTLTKLADFNNSTPLFSPAPQNVNDSPVLIGGKLWFTCEKGGANAVGSLSYFDVSTHAVSVALSFDNNTGQTPKASPVFDGNSVYITTIGSTSGSIYSTLFRYDIVANTYEPRLWEATGGSTPHARSPWGGVTIIDRGTDGKDLYFNTYSGGDPSYGTIQRYQTNTGLTTQVHAFPGNPGSRAPYKGFTAVGTDLYFTTFNGGTGLGTLGKLDVSVRGAETVSVLAAMPTVTDNYAQLPSHNPYYRALDHSLYFTTVGSNTQPGALMKFDLNTSTLSFLHKIQGGPTTGNFPEGNKCYGPVAEWNKQLYYTTIGGGANVPTGTGVGGTINRYNLQTGVHETLFSLDAGTNNGFGGEVRGGCVFNGSTSDPAFYLITKQGGLYDHGTVLRMNLDPEIAPSTYELWITGFPGVPPRDSALNADPDGDGRPNHAEFAFGTSPLSGADGNGFTAISTQSGLEIRWTARNDGSVTYSVEGSPTLGQGDSPWAPVAALPETMAVPDIAVPFDCERRRVVIPIDSVTGFFHVKATLSSTALP